MQMLKQILLELYFERKQNKSQCIKDIGMLAVFAAAMFVIQIPAFCLLTLVIYLSRNKAWREKEKVPEIVCFLPMEARELQRFVKGKNGIAAMGAAVMLWIAYVYIAVSNSCYVCNGSFLEYITYAAAGFFFYFHFIMIRNDYARQRNIRVNSYMQAQGLIYSKPAFPVFLIISWIVIILCGLNAFPDIEVEEPPFISMPMRICILILFILEVLLYQYLKKRVLKDLIFTDYNTKVSKVQEAGYEY